MILYNYVPFQKMGTSLKGKNLLRAVPKGMENHFHQY